ncbi:GNAT family N-acetyltransferase [Leifsonia sp. Leaf264]|uniref:GNAT family N-acetyltransferase n=1 Tax=Leifsonia sp. Leaf264 TaxID=1736314 RepID=UPI00138EE169|nr:GNAT family N-acetyltransferase [Leifsonia sp. Leaf264]
MSTTAASQDERHGLRGSVEIRPARPDEYDEVGRVTERAFAEGPYGHLPVTAERRELVLDVAARAASGAVLVAVAPDGVIVGTVTLVRAGAPQSRLAVGDEAELRLLGVLAAARGLGLGRALALAAEEVALGWGAASVVLDTGTRNLVSQTLYRSLGYELMPNQSTEPDGSPIRHVEFIKPLRDRADVLVRLVLPEEYEAAADLSERAYTIEYDITETYRASIRQIAERAQEHQVWVAVDTATGALLGAVATPRPGRAISPLAREGELDFRLLAVDPPARGRGIGALLTRHVIELARLRRLDHVVMNSGQQMVGAHRLYEKLGFGRLPEREGAITEGGRTIQLLAFTIPVGAAS